MQELSRIIQNHQSEYHQVVSFDPSKDKLYHFDFTSANNELSDADIADTNSFSGYVKNKMHEAHAKYGIGGYNEDRALYRRSKLFDGDHPRTIHLGTDIWGEAGTKLFAPLGGRVHSFAFNNEFGDYGATIILQHQLDTFTFFTLYGHLSKRDLAPLRQNNYMHRGEVIGHFGEPEENGNWPPHLHFQIIEDMRVNLGDYPGVVSKAEKEKYLSNCPDPDLILQMMQYCK